MKKYFAIIILLCSNLFSSCEFIREFQPHSDKIRYEQLNGEWVVEKFEFDLREMDDKDASIEKRTPLMYFYKGDLPANLTEFTVYYGDNIDGVWLIYGVGNGSISTKKYYARRFENCEKQGSDIELPYYIDWETDNPIGFNFQKVDPIFDITLFSKLKFNPGDTITINEEWKTVPDSALGTYSFYEYNFFLGDTCMGKYAPHYAGNTYNDFELIDITNNSCRCIVKRNLYDFAYTLKKK